MPKLELQGSVEEQAAQLYDMAMEAMAEGRFSGAVRYLAEIERALPGFRDVPQRLTEAKQARREQRNLLWTSLIGGMLGIVVARLLGASSELALIAAAVAGLILGYVIGFFLFRQPSSGNQ